jgi:hypothetical protein
MNVIVCGQNEVLGDECVFCGGSVDRVTRGGLEGPHGWRFCELECMKAVGVCSGCPVQAACNAWAEAAGEVGVWGARYRRLPTTPVLSPKQRRRAAAKEDAA